MCRPIGGWSAWFAHREARGAEWQIGLAFIVPNQPGLADRLSAANGLRHHPELEAIRFIASQVLLVKLRDNPCVAFELILGSLQALPAPADRCNTPMTELI